MCVRRFRHVGLITDFHCLQHEKFEVAKFELHQLLQFPNLKGVPLLVVRSVSLRSFLRCQNLTNASLGTRTIWKGMPQSMSSSKPCKFHTQLRYIAIQKRLTMSLQGSGQNSRQASFGECSCIFRRPSLIAFDFLVLLGMFTPLPYSFTP